MWGSERKAFSKCRITVHYERNGIRDSLTFKSSFFIMQSLPKLEQKISLELHKYLKVLRVGLKKFKTNQFWFSCHIIHLPINMGTKKSSLFTCTMLHVLTFQKCGPTSLYLYNWKSKTFLKSSLNSHVYWEHSVDCWLLIKCKRSYLIKF